VLPYYTFVVKGYHENAFNYAPVARVVQAELEEKAAGRVPGRYDDALRALPDHADTMVREVSDLRGRVGVPFLSTDRSVLNLPAVGKSLTFRVIGITRYGRRILEFDHDRTRAHSPIIDRMGKVIVIEPKSVGEFLAQLEELGERAEDYQGIYGFSLGQTEPRMSCFEYPPFEFSPTEVLSNFVMPDEVEPVPREPGAATLAGRGADE